MTERPDYAHMVEALPRPLDPGAVGPALLEGIAAWYVDTHGDAALHEFEQSGARYLFDLTSAAGLDREDRTVAAWALTPEQVARRDVSYQRGYPLARHEGAPEDDRGHLVPHLSGGLFGPNLFRQDRALNRGWSEQGKRYRALEREVAGRPGSLWAAHLLYDDDSAWPRWIDVVLLRGDEVVAERFDNRPGRD